MIVIPEGLWEALLDRFADQPPEVERIAFLDGYRVEGIGVATTLVLPEADCYPGFYTVRAAAMSAAGAHLRQYQMQRLMQVHTHGNAGLDHSVRDDQMAYSQRTGALSLVLPYHARRRPAPWVGQLHVRDRDGWHAVPEAEMSQFLTVVPALIDQRSDQTRIPSPVGMPAHWEDVCGAWIRRIRSQWWSRWSRR